MQIEHVIERIRNNNQQYSAFIIERTISISSKKLIMMMVMTNGSSHLKVYVTIFWKEKEKNARIRLKEEQKAKEH